MKEYFSLTSNERKIFLFLVGALCVGAGIRFYQSSVAPKAQAEYRSSDSTFQALSAAEMDSAEGRTTSPEPGAKKKEYPQKKLNVNAATKEELTSLPGIGEKTAERILERRAHGGKYGSLEELKHVKGMTAKRFEQIQSSLVAE